MIPNMQTKILLHQIYVALAGAHMVDDWSVMPEGAQIIKQVLLKKRKSLGFEDYIKALDIVCELNKHPEFQRQNRYLLKSIVAQLIRSYVTR